MRDLFPGYYAPKDFQELWDKATFVLDANVLLNLYRFPKPAAEELLSVLDKVSDRLWVPYQAALEYQVNRLDVINEQRERFEKVRTALDKSLNDLTSAFEKLQLKKRHSSIDPDPFLAGTRSFFNEFKTKLKGLEKHQRDVSDLDELRDKIDKLLSGKIGAPPKSQKELDQVYVEGKERYRFRRPPGYMDTEKGRDPTSQAPYVNDLRFEREYGDPVAWKQILDYAKQRKVQHLILITDDEKEDWWLFIKEKTIGPRPELLDEITFGAGVKTFHMYTSERFLQFAQSHLQHQVTDQSIEQIRDVIEANSVEIFRSVKSDFFREQAIQSWLQLAHEESIISRYPGVFPRYVLPNADGVRVAYEVQLCPDPLIYSTLKDNVQTANAEIAAGKFDVFVVIFVLADEAFASELRETIQRMPDVHGPRISFIISIIVRRRDALGIQRAVLNVLHEFL